MKKLIGSTTSPYVRRIRLMLDDNDYEFEQVAIFTPEGQATVAKYTTTARIPLLVDGETVIWDSLLIAGYLNGTPFPLEVQKELVLINEMTDSGIQLFQLRKFEIDPEDKGVFSQNNLKRIGQVLDYFETKDLNGWGVVEQWLYCTLDWYTFREVYPWKTNHPNLVKFYESHQNDTKVKATDPR